MLNFKTTLLRIRFLDCEICNTWSLKLNAQADILLTRSSEKSDFHIYENTIFQILIKKSILKTIFN